MKKIILLFVCVMVIGCSSKLDTVKCRIEGKDAEFTLKNGMIDKYVLGGEQKTNREVDEINGEFFTSSKDNEEAKDYLVDYVDSLGGTCDN